MAVRFYVLPGSRASDAAGQSAAGVFEHLRDYLGGHAAEAVLVDLSAEVLNMLVQIYLAEAQQCFLQKAIRDQMKPTILAKLAAQVCCPSACSLL
jgi:programmed cell death 6-interacting protein